MTSKRCIILYIFFCLLTDVWAFQDTKDKIKVVVTHDNVQTYDVDFRGIIRVSDEDKDVIAISPDGYLKISKSAFGNNRTILIESDENGTLTKTFYNGKNQEPFEPAGRKWLQEILPSILRTNEIAVEQRVKRIYTKNGIQGFLDEVNQMGKESTTSESLGGLIKYEIHFDSESKVRNAYYSSLIIDVKLKQADLALLIPELAKIKSNSTKGSLLREILYRYSLSNNDLVNLLKTTSTLEYNTERGSVLRVLNPMLPMDTEVLNAYFYVIKKMEINSEKGNVLKHLLQHTKLSDYAQRNILSTINSFSSEREKGAILLAMIPYLNTSKIVQDKFVETINNIDSQYYVLKGEILKSYVGSQNNPNVQNEKNKQICMLLLDGSKNLISNSQRGENLRQVNKIFVNDPEVMSNYMSILKGLTNNLESYNVILDLLNENTLDKNSQIQVLKYAKRLVNDDYQHAAGAVLRELLPQLVQDPEVSYAFLDVISFMDQNSTIEELLRLAIADKKVLQYKTSYIKIMSITGNISVDIERSLILQRLWPYINEAGEEFRYIYKEAAEGLGSEYWKYKTLADFSKQ